MQKKDRNLKICKMYLQTNKLFLEGQVQLKDKIKSCTLVNCKLKIKLIKKPHAIFEFTRILSLKQQHNILKPLEPLYKENPIL